MVVDVNMDVDSQWATLLKLGGEVYKALFEMFEEGITRGLFVKNRDAMKGKLRDLMKMYDS